MPPPPAVATPPEPGAGLAAVPALDPATPLWRRVPTRDADGARLGDFMLLIPGLRRRPPAEQGAVLGRLDAVLRAHAHAVVFADCNLKLNLLWVSVRPLPGICVALPRALCAAVPEARLVSLEAGLLRRSAG